MGPTGNTRVVQIHPTRRCNLRCLHCYSSSSPDERDMLDLKALLAAVNELAAEGFNWLSLSGGEPILYRPLAQLLERAKREGMNTAMVSNGMLLTPKRLDEVGPHVDLLVISLDGSPNSHNAMRGSERAFDVMASRLAGIRDRGIPFGFIFTLTQHNLDELPWVAEFAVNCGARLLQIHPLEDYGNAAQQLPGKVPDGIEAAHAWLFAQQLRENLGERMAVQVDLIHSEAVRQQPELIFAGTGDVAANTGLADLISPLVVEPDGWIVPLQYGFPRAHALGRLGENSVRDMAHRWRTDRWPAFQAICRSLSARVGAAAKPHFFNWYEAIAAVAEEQARQCQPVAKRHEAPTLSIAG